jgi:hypothetical protein
MKSIKSAFKRMMGTKAEDGQAIVLIALFMVVMLAMVGVAIDGGGLFLLWRDAQNAADTAALQAAYDRCTSTPDTLTPNDITDDNWVEVGKDAADINGFDDRLNDANDPDTPDDFSADVLVTVTETFLGTPPIGYVHVTIQADKPSYFIQLVYRGPLRVKAEALVYCSAAVDFTDLPGMVGLGGCTCNGNANERIQNNSAYFKLPGSAHSNCDLSLSSNNAGGGTATGPLTATGSATTGNVTLPPGTTPKSGVTAKTLAALIPIELYFPTGEIYDAIDAHPDGIVHYKSGNYTVTNADFPLQGLWAVEGDFTIPNNVSPPNGTDTFGIEGFTVVSRTGTIEYNKSNRDTTNWAYYGYNADNAASSGHPGVTITWSRGNGSAIAAYTTKNIADPNLDGTDPPNHTDEDCTSNDTNGIYFTGAGEGPPPASEPVDIDITGLVFAPWSHIQFNGTAFGIKGPIIAWAIDMSASGLCWIPEPTFLQPMAPIMQNAARPG